MKLINSFIRNRNFFIKAANIRKSNILKVVLCGAAGKIGQSVSLLLKQSPYVEELALYDIKDTYGLGLELNHIDTKCNVKSYQGADQLCDALSGAKVVTIAANTQDNTKNLFEANANIVSSLMFAVTEFCPERDIEKITKKLLDACESCELLEENESPSLASSFAIARFISTLAMATKTRKSIIECAYVKCNEKLLNIKYCSTPLQINATGIEQNLGLPKMSEYENMLFEKSSYYLKKDIELGESYCITNKIIEE